MPLPKRQRPVSLCPPSTGSAVPAGAVTAAARGTRPPAKICSIAASGRKAPISPMLVAPVIVVHAIEASMYASASISSR